MYVLTWEAIDAAGMITVLEDDHATFDEALEAADMMSPRMNPSIRPAMNADLMDAIMDRFPEAHEVTHDLLTYAIIYKK